jgi:hypothetical protein
VRASGAMVVTRAALATACRGVIAFTARAGTKTVLTQRAPLTLRRGVCSATTKLTLRNRRSVGRSKTLSIGAGFPGNTALTARNSRRVSARIT